MTSPQAEATTEIKIKCSVCGQDLIYTYTGRAGDHTLRFQSVAWPNCKGCWGRDLGASG